jgi:hypothetical protein
MSRARHKKSKAKGGAVYYEGGESNVAKEAAEKKRGGAVMKHPGKVAGEKGKKRLDRRARGGRVGSDQRPFSSAATPRPTGEASEP